MNAIPDSMLKMLGFRKERQKRMAFWKVLGKKGPTLGWHWVHPMCGFSYEPEKDKTGREFFEAFLRAVIFKGRETKDPWSLTDKIMKGKA